MLVSLHVKNLALIEETEVWFQEGLNILTGETGAGKSVILGSVSLALGAKADKELIRTGCEYALVELIFQADKPKLIEDIKRLELPVEEDGEVIIARRIMQGRSVSKVNGETVSARQLKELAGLLIDIHGQHEHQSLLQQKKHFEVLDDYAAKKLAPCKVKLKAAYERYSELSRQLKEGELDEPARQRELAMAEFEYNEIERAELKAGEDEELETAYRKMVNAKRIMEAVNKAYCHMSGEGNGEGAADGTGRALRELISVAEYDDALNGLVEQLSQMEGLMTDFNRELAGYISDLTFDEEDFIEVQERLNEVNRLKDKYGNRIEDVLLHAEKLREQCGRLADYEAYRKKLEAETEAAEKLLAGLCGEASIIRRKAASVLEKQMKEALIDLNFQEVEFKIEVREQEGKYRADGFNEVEFMISTNQGEPVKPLGSVASGGELSRIMLAIKTVLADKDEIDTLIFDEIDAGISGKTAWRVSEKLAVIKSAHQVICITHLPQIAAMADTHFVIEKKSGGGKTTTHIRVLQKEEEIEELARLLGGDKPTGSTYENARELKEQAAAVKGKRR